MAESVDPLKKSTKSESANAQTVIVSLNFENLEHEYFASINFRDFTKNDKFRAFNFAKIDKKTALENRFLLNDYLNKEVWKLILRERLNLSHERKNLLHDRYSCLYKRLPGRLADSVIGHLSREISRPMRFFLLRGGVASRGLLSLKS